MKDYKWEAKWWHWKHVLINVIGTIILTAIAIGAAVAVLWLVSIVEGG